MSWMEINILIPRLISLFLILLQIFSLRWINWHIYLCLLPILLLCTLRYVRVYANFVFLWLHGLHLLWFLPHAWNRRFPRSFAIRPSHLSVHQVWVVGWSSSRFISHVFSPLYRRCREVKWYFCSASYIKGRSRVC